MISEVNSEYNYLRNDETYRKIDLIGRAGVISLLISITAVAQILMYFSNTRTGQIILFFSWLFSVIYGYALIRWMIYTKTLPSEVPLSIIIGEDKIILKFKNKKGIKSVPIRHYEIKELYINNFGFGKIFNINFYLKNEKSLYIRVSKDIMEAITEWYKRKLIYSESQSYLYHPEK